MRQRQFVSARVLVSLIVALAVVAFSLGVDVSPRAARAYQSNNLLQNPGFEPPFVSINGDSTLQVATGWQPWYIGGSGATAVNARPEYKAAPSNRVRSGSSAQEYNSFYATHDAGVYQRVSVAPNTALQFSVYVYVWSSAPFDNPNVSEDPNDVQVRVGIDPTGGTNPQSASIVWSTPVEFYDEYRQLSVSATSSSTAVTVYVRSQPQNFVGTNTIYLDDAFLGAAGTGPQPTQVPQPTQPTQAPPPTQTPQPTQAPPTPAPQATTPPQPSATPVSGGGGFNSTVTHTVQRGDTVSELARRYGSTIAAIVQANSLPDAGLIYVGQTLLIPVSAPQYTPPPTFTPAPISGGESGGPLYPTQPPVYPGGVTYVVQPGDTLSSIAARYHSTIGTLAQLNNILNPNLIFVGQVLQVPPYGFSQPPQAPPVPQYPLYPQYPQQPIKHVVQLGENLFRISLRYGVSMDAIMRANTIYHPNLIFAGQVLTIPK